MQAKTIVTNEDRMTNQVFPVTDPRGELVAEYDRAAQQVHVSKDKFRDWARHRKHNANKVFEDLLAAGIISNMGAKRTLASGTIYGRGRSLTFTVDLAHPDVGGAAPHFADAPAPASNVVPLRPVRS
jgi:hypothetical protein